MYKRLIALMLSFFFVGGCIPKTSGVSIPIIGHGGAIEVIPATLSKPEGPGPFSPVVILHDCSGLGPASSGAPARWAKELVRRGCVAA
jgi:dienelactone hydrolase